MAPVALDADVVIAFLDPGDAQHERAVALLTPVLAGAAPISVSASVYAEVLVRPLQQGTDAAVDRFLRDIDASVVAVDRAIARSAARLRGAHRALRLPDALSLATALGAGAELLTLDEQLRRVAERERTTSPRGSATDES